MKDELDEELCKKYPKIFRDRHAPMNVTCMCWGLSVGDGWYDIIDNACSNIQYHINHSRKSRANALKYNRALKRALDGDKKGLIWYHSYKGNVTDYTMEAVERSLEVPDPHEIPEACPQVVAVQVKEKFGTLRFYYDGGDEFVNGVIRMAEAMSAVTCEDCAKPARVGGKGWISVRCDTCREKSV